MPMAGCHKPRGKYIVTGDELLPLPEAQMLLSCLKTNQQKARFRALLKEIEDGARRWEYRGHSAAEMRALELL